MDRAAIEEVRADAYRVPTDAPGADATFAWDATTMVVVRLQAGGALGLGYSYGAAAMRALIEEALAPVVRGRDAFDIPAAYDAMARQLRNIGRPGIGAMAVAAVEDRPVGSQGKADALCRAFGVPLSAHTAPALHLHPCCAAPSIIHLEYFHDHARIEQMLFEGAVEPSAGRLTPDLARTGHGLRLREAEAARYRL